MKQRINLCFRSKSEEHLRTTKLDYFKKGKNKHAEEILSEAAIRKFRPKADDTNTGAASVNNRRALDSCLCYKRLLNISTELVADIPTLPKEEVVSSKDREHAFIWLDYW